MRKRSECGCVRLVSTGTMVGLVLIGAARAQETIRVSVDSGGAQANHNSYEPAISAAGRYVAFGSAAGNLVGGDSNTWDDVFVHDCQSGTTERVSISTGGTQGNFGSWDPCISADGRYVAFSSLAKNLVSGDTNDNTDIFLRDRQNGTTERVSVDSSGSQGNSYSVHASISADARFVAFESDAPNLVGGDTNGVPDVFVRDRQSGTTERVSIDSNGAQANSSCYEPSISADGRYVAFYGYATNFVAGDTNNSLDVFVRDRQSGTTECVSVDSGGVPGNGTSSYSSVSVDGRYVAFASIASNLVSGDTNGRTDIFLRNRQSGTTERVSVDSSGSQGDDHSRHASISADARFVAFESDATNLVGGDTNDDRDVFVHDRQSGITERVSVASSGAQSANDSFDASIGADGRYVTFASKASNLVAGDTNGWEDIFVHDRNYRLGAKYCTANANSTGAPADLSAAGSASSGAGYLSLTSIPVPNQSGVFFHGVNQAQNPFGNGFQCTTGGIVRGAVVTGVGNVALYIYDNSDAKHSLAAFIGNTRNFQYWFRDPMGGGAFFNTSNAVSIAIEP